MARAEKIFTASHRPDPHWPLDRLSDALTESRKQAWEITTERRHFKNQQPEFINHQSSIKNVAMKHLNPKNAAAAAALCH